MKSILDSFNVSRIKPIRDLIYESLRQAIFEGELKAGDRLVEKDLAEKMNVSRTPIREALRKLETEGLVKHLPRKGVVVRGFKREDVIEIYSIRKALEISAITYTVENITDDEINKLKEKIEIMEILTYKEDTVSLFNVSQEFNDILIRACRMPRLINLINTYLEYLEQFRRVTMKKKKRRLKALEEHKQILQAVIDKDVEKAKNLVEIHLQGALNAYLQTFTEDVQDEFNEENT
ncbi:MAG: GntR family transcriptional regulator [Thermoanaerobacteraceae bacterium]|nr:GntR family transcriptional regulator [Thermoanaerobacteraceae bacterium]